MLIGYARVSTRDQNHDLQLDALSEAGCTKIFEEKLSAANRDRPQLQAALDYVRAGDTLVVWKLDRLARSLKQLIETVEMLAEREIGFARSPKTSTRPPRAAASFFMCSALSPNSNAPSFVKEQRRDLLQRAPEDALAAGLDRLARRISISPRRC